VYGGPFFLVSSFLHSTYVDHGNKIQNALFHATTDPPQVTVKLWLPRPPHVWRACSLGTRRIKIHYNDQDYGFLIIELPITDVSKFETKEVFYAIRQW